MVARLSLCILLLSGCVSHRDLPLGSEIGLNPHGAYIELKQKNQKGLHAGELIATQGQNLLILDKKSGLVETLPLTETIRYRVRYAQNVNYGWTIPLFVASSFAHGYFGIITLFPNAILPVAIATRASTEYTYTNRQISVEQLNMFTRFPQGVPAGVDLKSIH